jgi:hypothetical protein
MELRIKSEKLRIGLYSGRKKIAEIYVKECLLRRVGGYYIYYIAKHFVT